MIGLVAGLLAAALSAAPSSRPDRATGAIRTPSDAASQALSYRAEMAKYRQERLAELTAPNGWLAVQGLFWLHEGANIAGSDPAAEVHLPSRAPKRLGVFTMAAGKVTFTADPASLAAGATARVRVLVR